MYMQKMYKNECTHIMSMAK